MKRHVNSMNHQVLDTVRDHFLNPRNQIEISDPDLVLEMGSIAEGNAVKLMIKFDAKQRISAASFQSFGACESIAVFSILTELLVGKTAQEAAAITEKDIIGHVWEATSIPLFETERALRLMRETCWERRAKKISVADSVHAREQ